ncbi:hypothetical protein [Sporosarcina aquimarina]|uniref:hypothetical protein n=1 Tax=Sporosarcina aquimarina TaxID=114975 RepID=UPI00295E8ABC|nr:hypothetical protein [Sporosarcina aquimarina]
MTWEGYLVVPGEIGNMGRVIGNMVCGIGTMQRGIGIIKRTISTMGELIGNRLQFNLS